MGDLKAPVALVAMPFLATDRPALGLSLLKASLKAQGIPSAVHYLNLWFAEEARLRVANELRPFAELTQVEEWVFVEAMWGRDGARDAAYRQEILRGHAQEHCVDGRAERALEMLIDDLWACRQRVPAFLERCIRDIPWSEYLVVGFSSLVQQQNASLALARELKAAYPELVVVFGGGNCEGRAGRRLLKSFPFIDAVCSGEGEEVFPRFVSDLLAGRPSRRLSGMSSRWSEDRSSTGTAIVLQMDRLPPPDFDDFFTQRTSSSVLPEEETFIVAENSRGCWWGEKSQCAFCGLNGNGMKFREKSAERSLGEISALLERYGRFTRKVLYADRILSMKHLRSLVPRLEHLDMSVVCWETKANLKKNDLQTLKQAGVQAIQPGIESFSTRVLGLIGKGTTALQNIQLLKWCRELGLQPLWNYLVGFPGERAADYARQPDLIRTLTHLPAPMPPGVAGLRLERFSPYQEDPARFGISKLRPHPSYGHVFPGLEESSIAELAWYFTADFEGQEEMAKYIAEMRSAVGEWIRLEEGAALFSLVEDGRLVICDFRPLAEEAVVVLEHPVRQLYEACDSIRKRPYLERLLATRTGCDVGDGDLETLLTPLIEKGLMLKEGERYLNLAIPLESGYVPPEAVWPHLSEVLEVLESRSA